MKHVTFSGEPQAIDNILTRILSDHGDNIKSVSVQTGLVAVQTEEPELAFKLSIVPKQPVVQYVNMTTLTILYSLPNDAAMDIQVYLQPV